MILTKICSQDKESTGYMAVRRTLVHKTERLDHGNFRLNLDVVTGIVSVLHMPRAVLFICGNVTSLMGHNLFRAVDTCVRRDRHHTGPKRSVEIYNKPEYSYTKFNEFTRIPGSTGGMEIVRIRRK